jgi:hypothetical protein
LEKIKNEGDLKVICREKKEKQVKNSLAFRDYPKNGQKSPFF